jgi:hypothetical protein
MAAMQQDEKSRAERHAEHRDAAAEGQPQPAGLGLIHPPSATPRLQWFQVGGNPPSQPLQS